MRLILSLLTALVLGAFIAYSQIPGRFLAGNHPSASPQVSSSMCQPVCPEAPGDSVPSLSVVRRPCPECGQDEALWRRQTEQPPPQLLGKSAALLEGGCGRMIYGLSSHERLAPASLTKIATALAVREAGNPQEMVDVRINGWELVIADDSTVMGLEAGMRLSVEDLLQGLLLMSGNDAAISLADHFGGQERFVGRMNDIVTRLGLDDTHFRNPHGLDADGHYSSAFDLAILGRTLLADPLLETLVSTQQVQASWSPATVWNGNWLLYVYPDAKGIKTGYTEAAGSTIVAAAERNGRTLVATVLNSPDVFWDSMRLFDWAFARVPEVC